ncbi:transmembrane protein 170A-like [Vespa mandarinia]|uniref:transmembrane protein 170A-like n=1 Tax=Vespa mandarinia TaxID=7446 RepID=UPI00160BAE89|nr:transmembrane protein 170A-like [Vespa mandarinia]XP_035737355.1 transmembrane protein 170A-like [Vespa mandarinia]XP_035737356.1 transmembrane protein 170A-like [Vespa mandarinia]XP_046836078.1 transmembrane protein 170A [Vespa crabro]XP_046836079.1 transmembrane protein 170A [Vespa crabro]XP_046836080.1 transmembrane protein 170A [Vespa crabro]XP_046836081.1 transmembrane protein 170A [Vespa crabro]XP_046836082.1 transmembrane protein 170A [Vespa crabro]XP_047366018.1 transmembrane pro
MNEHTENSLPHTQVIRNMNAGNIFYMPLTSFAEMWYQIFLWALFSSIFVHMIAGTICFATLRQHKYGKFFPLLIIIMGILLPLTSGVLSSAAVAFVYRASSHQMPPLYALVWGIGQTFVAACVGFTRILATL